MRLRTIVALILLAPAVSFGWGFDGHRRLAAYTHEVLPEGSCLRAWLETVTHQFSWTDQSCDPDRWRSSDPDEWPRHYLDIDYADPYWTYPRDWAAIQAQFKQYADDNGRVPFRVEEVYRELVARMKAKDSSAALVTVAHLSHYVTDAFSPMHDTKEQPGDLHIRYESDMLAVEAHINEITDRMRAYYGAPGKVDPKNHTFDAVIAGNPVGRKIVSDDQNNGGSASALFENTKDLTARRWGDAETMMASLIGTAWLEAGKPMLQGMPAGCDATVPDGEPVLKGFPLPPPTWKQDGGTPGAGDAGSTGDAGGAVADGGMSLNDAGTGGEVDLAPSCGGCGGVPAAALFPVLLGAMVLPRRRRHG